MTTDGNPKGEKVYENITLDEMDNTAPPSIPKSKDGMDKKEELALTHKEKQFKNELGWLGKPFGGKSEKPGNISGLVIFLCFAFLALAYFFKPATNSGMAFEDIFVSLISVITLILGYLFGSNDRGSGE